MKEYKSDFRDAHNHSNIVVALDGDLSFGTDWILSYFEGEISRGISFHANETAQIGWMIVILKANENGDLEIWEPRFDSVPIVWIRGANNTVRHLMTNRNPRPMGVVIA